MACLTIGGYSGSAQGACNESVAHDRLVLGVCALVFESILIFGGALRSLDRPLIQIIEFFPFDNILRPSDQLQNPTLSEKTFVWYCVKFWLFLPFSERRSLHNPMTGSPSPWVLAATK